MRRKRPMIPGTFPGRGQRTMRVIPPLFQEAHQLFAIGQYDQAAEAFENLAVLVLARGGLNAPRLYLRAGQANLLAGKPNKAVELFYSGLNLLIQQQRWIELDRLGNRVINQLKESREVFQAEELAGWIQKALEANGQKKSAKQLPELNQGFKLKIPLKCPGCGGPVNPKEVEWVDEFTVECDFCGSLIRGERN